MDVPLKRMPGAELRIMTSNIWGDYFGNPPHEREDLLADVFLRYLPDALAMQEVTPNWWKSRLFERLKGEYVVVEGDGPDQTNYIPLLYRPARLELIDGGWQLYHGKLDRSKGFTWGVFKDKETGKKFVGYSTHFWYKGSDESNYIRTVNAEKLMAKLTELQKKYDCPVVGGGDFNCNVSSDPFKLMAEFGFESAQEIAEIASPECSHHGDPKRGDDGKCHGQPRPENNVKAYSIDHLVVYKPRIRLLGEYVILDQDALDATDHSPIFTDIVLK